MISTFDIIVYCSISAMMVLLLMALGIAVSMPMLDRWSKRFFITSLLLLILCVIICLFDEIIYLNPVFVTEERIIAYLEALFVSFLIILPTILLLHYCGEKVKGSTLFCAVISLWFIYFITLSIGHFTNWFYYVTPENIFVRTPLFPLLMLPAVLGMIVNIAGLIRRRKKLSLRYFIAFLIYLLPFTGFITLHAFLDITPFLFFGIGACALSMCYFIISDQIINNYIQQREIANQSANVMVLQMRPHFIYNTMMSIYYLCKQDADKAQQVTLDFTTYLRKNFTAVASEKPVPFKDELEHTRAYLAVEQAQHEDMLYVDYDTPHVDFKVPPLTLQPLLENAVKHSLDPNGEPLRIYVKTRLTDSGSEIVVENNGTDYQPANDNQPHTALVNIQQRLDMMCKGTLSIAPREGGGTVVKVIIPNTKQ